MRAEFLLLFLAVGVGNYLMRFLPLLWTLRWGEKRQEDAASGSTARLLPLVGPSVVVALLVTSILPEVTSGAGLIQIGAALLLTLVVAVRLGNLGLTVLVGVAAYWVISLVV